MALMEVTAPAVIVAGGLNSTVVCYTGARIAIFLSMMKCVHDAIHKVCPSPRMHDPFFRRNDFFWKLF